MIEMIINQLQSFSIKDKGNVISQNWAPNLDEYCQEEGIDNISIEDEKPQQKDGEDKKEEEGSKGGNLSDNSCKRGIITNSDERIRVHKQIIEGKVTRNQQKATIKNIEVEKPQGRKDIRDPDKGIIGLEETGDQNNNLSESESEVILTKNSGK